MEIYTFIGLTLPPSSSAHCAHPARDQAEIIGHNLQNRRSTAQEQAARLDSLLLPPLLKEEVLTLPQVKIVVDVKWRGSSEMRAAALTNPNLLKPGQYFVFGGSWSGVVSRAPAPTAAHSLAAGAARCTFSLKMSN